MPLGAIWADGVWDESVWDSGIWAQGATSFVVDPFSFSNRPGQALSALNVESGAITLTGVSGTQAVSFTGDASLEWSKNGGGWLTGSTTIVTGDTMNLRLDASSDYSTAVSAVMTVGTGVSSRSGTFSVITIPDPALAESGGIHGNVSRNITGNVQRDTNG